MHRKHHTGLSTILTFPTDMVPTFPLDYVHLMCLDVLNELLALWLQGPVKNRYHLYWADVGTLGRPNFCLHGQQTVIFNAYFDVLVTWTVGIPRNFA